MDGDPARAVYNNPPPPICPMDAEAPVECWVLCARDWPFPVVAASATWQALWSLPLARARGRPIGELLRPEGAAARAAGRALLSHVGRAAVCANHTTGRVVRHDCVLLDHGAHGLLAVSLVPARGEGVATPARLRALGASAFATARDRDAAVSPAACMRRPKRVLA